MNSMVFNYNHLILHSIQKLDTDTNVPNDKTPLEVRCLLYTFHQSIYVIPVAVTKYGCSKLPWVVPRDFAHFPKD